MQADSDSPREQAYAAFERRDWEVAFERLEAAAAQGLLEPADEMLMTELAMIRGGPAEAARWGERAVRSFERAGRPGDAGIACVFLFRIAGDQHQISVSMGWLKRAERFAEQAPDHLLHGHIAVAHAFLAYLQGDYEPALEFAREAERIARQHEDLGVEALAINRMGRILLRQGKVEEGQARIDEAMALVSSGNMSTIPSFIVYCSTIDACSDLADYKRAGEWTRAANSWCDQNDLVRWVGMCRIHRAELWRMRGAWEVAARELEEACSDLERSNFLAALVEGLREKGMQRLQAGDLAGAEAAFREAHAQGGNPQPGLAALWLAQGKVDAAVTALRSALDDIVGKPLQRAKVLPVYVEATIAAGDLDAAEAATTELEQTAELYRTSGLQAHAHAARGQLGLARGEARAAVSTLRRAVQEWHGIGAPYEVARMRGVLARAHETLGESEAANFEREAAQTAFARLGASLPGAGVTPRPDASTVAGGPGAAASGPAPSGLIDGKLEIVRKLGEGGMGTVYLARHKLTGRDVAVKLLRPGMCDEERHCQRLLQEALAGGQIRHPNVVDVYDAGTHEGAPYMVLEYLHGESLAQRLARTGPLGPREALEVLSQALAGVAAAHERGVVHRDLKPDNLFLVEADGLLVKVLDFGVAKLEVGGAASPTRTGALVGTPYYMAPEQIEGGDLDGRTDVYALGVVLYELVTGKLPFTGGSYGALLLSILRDEFPDCTQARPELSPELDALIRKATARTREDRFADAASFAAAIEVLLAAG